MNKEAYEILRRNGHIDGCALPRPYTDENVMDAMDSFANQEKIKLLEDLKEDLYEVLGNYCDRIAQDMILDTIDNHINYIK